MKNSDLRMNQAMKLKLLILPLSVLIACNNHQKETNIVDEPDQIMPLDSNDKRASGSVSHKENVGSSCDFDKFIADIKTPKLAKDIYLENDWNLSRDGEILALLDSLTAKNVASRPFYFKVVTKTYKKADGYFAEGLGLTGKEYVENNTKEFISNFDNKSCFTDSDLETWTQIVSLEFGLIEESEFNMKIIEDYTSKLELNCKDCSVTQKETINKFGTMLQNHWSQYLRNKDK